MAKPPSRNRDRTRQRILDAAAALLGEGGFKAFTVNGLSARAGVGKPLVYRYFGDLDGVLAALASEKARQLARENAASVPSNAPVGPGTFRLLRFGRLLSADPVLRALVRALLAGALPKGAADELLASLPSGEGDARAARAFLLGGIAFIVLAKDSCREFGGVPLNEPKELAKLEGVFAQLASSLER